MTTPRACSIRASRPLLSFPEKLWRDENGLFKAAGWQNALWTSEILMHSGK